MIDIMMFSIILLLCLYGVYYFYKQGILQIVGYIQNLKRRQWKTTTGKVIDSEYQFLKYQERTTGNRYQTRIDFFIKKTYTYTVNGKTYKSDQNSAADSLFRKQLKPLDQLPLNKKNIIFYEENPKTKQQEKGELSAKLYFHNKDTLQKKAKSIIGEEIHVYFNPNNPKKSCLYINVDKIALLSSIVMLIFGSISAYMCYFIIKDYLINSIHTITYNV